MKMMNNSTSSSEKLTLAPGINAEGNPVKDTLRKQIQSSAANPLLIGIRGKWYDVTSFVPHHPGGDILLDFVGQDATSQFIAYHDEKTVLKVRKPAGTYDYKPADEMDEEWLKLNDKYEKLGYFETPLSFVLSRVAILLGFLAASLTCVHLHLQSPNWLMLITGSIFLAGVWQQSGKKTLVCYSCVSKVEAK
jgi:delta8-fatty-acid desaturase